MPVALTLATAVVSEFQVTWLERFCVVPSLKMPLAMKASVVFGARVGLAGRTVMEASEAPVRLVTVNAAVPKILLEVAVIVVDPGPAPVARPELLTVAMLA